MAGGTGLISLPLTALMDRARYRQDIIDAMRRPYEGKPWADYRPIFLTQARIAGGTAFWQGRPKPCAGPSRSTAFPPRS